MWVCPATARGLVREQQHGTKVGGPGSPPLLVRTSPLCTQHPVGDGGEARSPSLRGEGVPWCPGWLWSPPDWSLSLLLGWGTRGRAGTCCGDKGYLPCCPWPSRVPAPPGLGPPGAVPCHPDAEIPDLSRRGSPIGVSHQSAPSQRLILRVPVVGVGAGHPGPRPTGHRAGGVQAGEPPSWLSPHSLYIFTQAGRWGGRPGGLRRPRGAGGKRVPSKSPSTCGKQPANDTGHLLSQPLNISARRRPLPGENSKCSEVISSKRKFISVRRLFKAQPSCDRDTRTWEIRTGPTPAQPAPRGPGKLR